MIKITAKFHSYCAETNKLIRKGHEMYFDRVERKCYILASNKVKRYLENQSLSNHIQAQENAYFDNFCSYNKI